MSEGYFIQYTIDQVIVNLGAFANEQVLADDEGNGDQRQDDQWDHHRSSFKEDINQSDALFRGDCIRVNC